MTETADRTTRHDAVGAALADRSDAALLATVRAGTAHGAGIGGTTASVTVAGAPVFVKLVRLTDREVEAGPGCTANLFALPAWYQYGVGVGSAGFNAWRELATHRLANGSVVDGRCPSFPLLHHWRVLPATPPPGSSTQNDDTVAFWRGSAAVGSRLRGLGESRAVLALFLEHVPHTLRSWLTASLQAGPAIADDAVALVERELFGAFEQLRTAGVTHFDGHLDNVLTDGTGIRLSDFGLATSVHFDLDEDERRFLELNADHDRAYGATALVNLIVTTILGLHDPASRNEHVRRCAGTGRADGLTGRPAQFVTRHARLATIVNDFYWRLHAGDVTTPFPAALVADALAGRT